MRERRVVRMAVVAGAVVAGGLAAPAIAAAAFSDSATATMLVTSDVLLPATSPAAGPGTCTPLSTDRIVLTWTATLSSWADGYEIARATSAGGPFTVIATVSAATTTYTDSSLSFSTTYHYAIRAKRNAWRSTDATTSRTTRNTFCG